MFTANAKLTGKTYSYDGNPHSFGARHPSYVNYAAMAAAAAEGTSPSQVRRAQHVLFGVRWCDAMRGLCEAYAHVHVHGVYGVHTLRMCRKHTST